MAPLSHRETEIVQLVAQGCRNKEVAQKLFITEGTVKSHLYIIFRKLRVFNRRELRRFANVPVVIESPNRRTNRV